MSGVEAHQAWFEERGLKTSLSDAGRSTRQIIKTLGRFGVRAIANPKIIAMFDELTRQTIAPSAHHLRFKNQIANATKGDIWGGGTFEALVNGNAAKLGLELKCSKCSSWNWYELKQLDYSMRCSLCLQEFGFPVLDPSLSDHSRWAYRLVGPFVLPDYASGGYGAALSIRFFSEVIGGHDHAGVTWSTGQLLKLSSAKSVEADFVLWYQRKQMFGCDHPTDLVFGEAKSFGRDTFKVDDVDRMKLLAEAFPGSVIVFSMKQAGDLSREEINRISRFALWGRERMSDRRGSRAPVLLLTGNELFARFSLQEAWKKVGGL